MRKKLLLLTVLSFSALFSIANPTWLRYPKIAPDGKTIVFNYKGDIYTVPTQGGEAKQLTTDAAYDFNATWSPDGKQIAFASDRSGNFDIYTINAQGGNLRQITSSSVREVPITYSPDGKYIYFSTGIQDPAESALFPTGCMKELYRIPANGGHLEQVLGTPAENICFSKDGKTFLYETVKGVESEWRKHHTSSVTRDVYLYNTENGTHTALYDLPGENRNPIYSPDEKRIYFLSEQGKSMNVYASDGMNFNKLTPITNFSKHPVRFLSIATNGTLCMSYDGEIYVKQPNQKPQKVNITLHNDEDADKTTLLSVKRGANDITISKDGKQMAFIVRGDVFVSHTEYGTTKQITSTSEAEEGISFAPDGRSLIYTSEREGRKDIYIAEIARKEEKYFSHATLINERRLMAPSNKERAYAQFAPDGKSIAYIEDRNNLMCYNIKTKQTTLLTDKSKNPGSDGQINFSWSPNSKWLTVNVNDNKHEPYADVAIVSADGRNYKNITQSGYMDLNPQWAMNGNAILYLTERFGMRNHASWGSQWDVMIAFMNQEAYDKFNMNKEAYELYKEENPKAKQDSIANVDFLGMEDRIERLTPNSANIGGYTLTSDGNTLYYLAAFEGGQDLWKCDIKNHAYNLVSKLNTRSANLSINDKNTTLYILGNAPMKMALNGGGKPSPINFNAEFALNTTKEREYMFDHVILQERERFYDKKMHGVDWDFYAESYRKHLPSINNNYDFAELLSELLGELNVSHTGARYRTSNTGVETAAIGALFDWNYSDNGLKIAEVLVGGPLNKKGVQIEKGDILEKINGREIQKEKNYLDYFANLKGKNTLFTFYRPSEKRRWEVSLTPISLNAQNELLYNRWVKGREEAVERLSNGRLGYVHIESMNDESFRRVYSNILGKYNNKEGIVIDTRFNTGGRLHEDIEILFSGEKYFTQVIRGTESCDMPSRRWNKPSVMITCEANYSNAHGTPWVYQHRHIGSVVGMPVPGTMTSVSWETLQDPSMYFGIPIIGYRLPNGSYLENTQLEPDYKIANKPEDIVKGKDAQLEKAVEVLLQQIDGKK